MLEIDNRYPEFAEPYEPVKGGKHHKKLAWAAAAKESRRRFGSLARAALLTVGAAVIFSAAAAMPSREPSAQPSIEITQSQPVTELPQG